MAKELTPMMQQYLDMKEQNKDCLLFFRLGDFYEMFLYDAELAARELDLTLTTRDRGKSKEEQVPMCGVPYHSAEGYIGRLVSKGHKVAICEQTEDPAKAKGLVEREVVRVITPGTVTASSMLDERKNNYISCIYGHVGIYGICFCDLSTGGFFATLATGEEAEAKVLGELGRFPPAEVLLGGMIPQGLKSSIYYKFNCCLDEGEPGLFYLERAQVLLEQHFAMPLARMSLSGRDHTVIACGALLQYLKDSQKNDLPHVRTIEFYTDGKFLELDLTARRNLELTETLRDKRKRGSLLGVLDHTATAMGGRLLRSWVEKPLLNPVEINSRLDAVEELATAHGLREDLVDALRGITDFERIMARVATGSANGRDLVALALGCRDLPVLKARLAEVRCGLLQAMGTQLDPMEDCCRWIFKTLVDEPPLTIREGGLIRPGADQEIDRLRDILEGGTDTMAQIESRERESTGIRNLKVGYNRVFGYYIEVPKAAQSRVPETYIRKQTLANGERYITPELKELESTILTAKDRITALEYDLFVRLRDYIGQAGQRFQTTATAVATVDCLCSLAQVAVRQNYCRPEVDLSQSISIADGRHPVVEQLLQDTLFVPNDTDLGTGNNQVAIITGPNMAGKSTYMRQVALIAIMAQMGSFVPAKSARIGVVDRVFTRVGASDDLGSGQSTFMVEMTEVAQILKFATARSLLILDEIGRGTSTFDGMAIARAVLEYVANPRLLGAKTLFATHYHELSQMEGQLPGVKNYNIAVKKRGDNMIFLRKIVPGAADRSYGVEVAGLAGLPTGVIHRARQLLKELESGGGAAVPAPRVQEPDQMSLGQMADLAVARELRKLTVETMTPIEAMNELYRLKKLLGDP